MSANELGRTISGLIDAGFRDEAITRSTIDRSRIDVLLSTDPTPPIYGFTTLLGHLDAVPATVNDQQRLLQAHLVGPTHAFPHSWGRLLLATKLSQLAHGQSGLHPDTHRALIGAAQTAAQGGQQWIGNWTASYSSGDVVSGAWFVEALCTRYSVRLAHRGDLIALISGSFVSTAAALIVVDCFDRLSKRALALIRATTAMIPIPTGVQLPVTLRDLNPVTNFVDVALCGALRGLRDRLSRASGNPLFFANDGEFAARSQSSFLDFTLTGALTEAIQAIGALAAYVRAAIRYATANDADSPDARVQPAKIAQALVRDIGLTALPTEFALTESEGVEDVGDLSLATARQLATSLSRFERLLDLAEHASPAALGEGNIDSPVLSDIAHLTDSKNLLPYLRQ
ncbi:aromatic amino acid lyase [Gulosibacter sediminis]|uniref:aromatic amino acid lyase n=1 Tax=Gulosibacter sediminis TaxID=1729695 RepID=UPI00186631FE|nr:aromatic amino acid lyase [Gulosibacter sediminis]